MGVAATMAVNAKAAVLPAHRRAKWWNTPNKATNEQGEKILTALSATPPFRTYRNVA